MLAPLHAKEEHVDPPLCRKRNHVGLTECKENILASLCTEDLDQRERDREWWLDFVQGEGVANFILREHAGFVQNRVQCHETLNYFLTSCLFFCRKMSFVVVVF